MAVEVELKFQIAAGRLAGVRRAVATRTAQCTRLAARYVDTPDGHLASARMALRLRLEGDAWVQTLKAEDSLSLRRHEHNVPLAPLRPGAEPVLDIGRHAHTPAGALLQQALAAAPDARLGECYRTEIQRTWRRVRHQGAVVELALDEGWLIAGPHRLAVQEIELELVSGPVAALLDLAGRWAARHDLVLDVRSKSERGQALAQQAVATADPAAAASSPPSLARPGVPLPGLSPRGAAAAMLANALQQVLANASQMANGASTPEHLHQLRVGLRRVRTVLAMFGTAWGGLTPALQADLSECATRLGALRDQDVLEATLWPALRAAGAPWLPESAPEAGGSARPLLASAPVQQLWLRLLGLAMAGQGLGAGEPGNPSAATSAATSAADLAEQPLADWARHALRRVLRQVRADARAFAELDDAARHRLRRRIKRLRYATEFCASLWPRPAVKRFIQVLQQAQSGLGDLNDSVSALAQCQSWVDREPRAWFAVGWLTARCALQRQACLPAMAALAELKGCWTGPAAKVKKSAKPMKPRKS